MKKLLFIFSAGLLLTACGGEKAEYEGAYDEDRVVAEESDAAAGDPSASATNEATTGTPAVASEFEKGAHLISLSDCLSCHAVDKKVVGPAYVAVAEKYEFNDKNVDYLAGKIQEGGVGVWGEIPMSPHPDLSKEQASEMARYILSLRDAK